MFNFLERSRVKCLNASVDTLLCVYASVHEGIVNV